MLEGQETKGKTCTLNKAPRHSLHASPPIDPFHSSSRSSSLERSLSSLHFTGATAAAAAAAVISSGAGDQDERRLLPVEPRLLLGDERLHRAPELHLLVHGAPVPRGGRGERTAATAPLRLQAAQLRRRRPRPPPAADLLGPAPTRGGARRRDVHRLLVLEHRALLILARRLPLGDRGERQIRAREGEELVVYVVGVGAG
uniref:Uncharacterized protein n=1 Tax=Oryza brachyantha TaxID=4533 RepID=J3L254_ORYBR